MNNVEQAPAPKPWRLSDRPGLTTGEFPSLSDVPDRPTDLPDPSEVNAKIAALQQERGTDGQGLSSRPSAATLGSPPAARITPISIPRSGPGPTQVQPGTASRPAAPILAPVRANSPSPAAPAPVTTASAPPGPPGPPPSAITRENTLTLNAGEPNWFDAQNRAAVASFAQSQAGTNSLILLMMEGPEFSDATVNPVRDQLVSSGIPQDRISVNFRVASAIRVRLRTLGQ